MALCPSLRGVTYEDPRFDRDGELPPRLHTSLASLERVTARWMLQPYSPVVRRDRAPTPAADGGDEAPAQWEDALVAEFAAPGAFGRRCRAQVLSRSGRGVGPIVDAYAAAISAWCAARGASHDDLVLAFLGSAPGRGWSDFAWAVPGACIEDAFGRFIAPGSHEHLTACARVLAVDPDPPFAIPPGFSRAPRGWFATGGTDDDGLRLYAAVDGKLVTGAITPMIRALLRGTRPAGSEAAHERLAELGLIERGPVV